MTKKYRLFFALSPQQPAACVSDLQHLALQCGCYGRAVPTENLHVTLAFIGAVTPADTQRLMDAVTAQPPAVDAFSLTFSTFGYWHRSQVIWLGCPHSPPPLQALVAHLNTTLHACGLGQENRRYTPHITLAKAVSKRPAIWPNNTATTDLTFHFSAFGLYISTTEHGQQGVRYHCLKQWPLMTCSPR